MSTKINARSPYYLSLTEPTQSTVEFTCSVANAQGFVVDSNGTITLPTLSYGTIIGISDDSFAAIASDGTQATRTLTLTIQIPTGYTNTESGTINCDVTYSQQPAAADASNYCPSTNSTIANQTLTKITGTATIDVSSKFSAGSGAAIAGYRVINNHSSFVNASMSGSNLSLTALSTCGTNTIQVEAFQNSSTCVAVQPVQITINGCSAFDCSTAGLSGGLLSQDGNTITKPTGLGTVGSVYAASTGGSALTTNYASTNGSASNQNVTLYFDVTIPNGFSNSGVFGTRCPSVLVQSGTGQPNAECPGESLTNGEALVFSGWRILANGSTIEGTVTLAGTTIAVDSYTTNFDENTGSSTISRNVSIVMTIPSGNANAGSKTCTLAVLQEAPLNPCGTYEIKLTQGLATKDEFCDNNHATITTGFSTVDFTSGAAGSSLINTIICNAGKTKFKGDDLFYGISRVQQNPLTGPGLTFQIVKINNSGTVTELHGKTCSGGGGNIQY